MATKQMMYDHPAYTTVQVASLGSIAAGSATKSQNFVAHANLTLKAVNYSSIATATGTSIDIKSLFIIRQGTSTTTQLLSTNTAAYVQAYVLLTGTAASMTQGDVAYVQKGTDGTETDAVSIEFVIQPGASVTV